MMVLTALSSLLPDADLISEHITTRMSTQGRGFVDIAVEGEDELWFIELKYYPLTLLFGRDWPFLDSEPNRNLSIVTQRKQLYLNKSIEPRDVMFVLGSHSENNVDLCQEAGFAAKFAGSKPVFALGGLEYLAQEQVKDYESSNDNVRRFTLIGAGTDVIWSEV